MDSAELRSRSWDHYANGGSTTSLTFPLVKRREGEILRDSCAAMGGNVGLLPSARRECLTGPFKPSQSSFAPGSSFSMSSKNTATALPRVDSRTATPQYGDAGGVNHSGPFSSYHPQRPSSLYEPETLSFGKRSQMEQERDARFQKPLLQPVSAPSSKLPSIHEALGYSAQFPSSIYRHSGSHSLPPSPLAGPNSTTPGRFAGDDISDSFPLLHGHKSSRRRQDVSEKKRLSVSSFQTENSQNGSVSSMGSSLRSPARSRRSTGTSVPTPLTTTSPAAFARPQSFPGQAQPCPDARQGAGASTTYTWSLAAPPDDIARQDVRMNDVSTAKTPIGPNVETSEIIALFEAHAETYMQMQKLCELYSRGQIRPDAVTQLNFDRLLHVHRQTYESMVRVRNTHLAHPIEEAKGEQIAADQHPRPGVVYESRGYEVNSQNHARRNPTYPAATVVPAAGQPYPVPEAKRRLQLAPRQRRTKAAPPGRCHSCSRSETPEWRRGPDGARTLCNACGLHYAKLARKQTADNKAAAANAARATAASNSPATTQSSMSGSPS